ncbi:GNAT family N-acetyltransferase [Halorarius halobius]|uniref:GNAT family N-acetyltransferase n=1 Tax=Halorarius halobius TaxID=2962671 RepID=UPI0020CCD1CE|nr:GNAT family N-acetyltransferase [Halorarius halobius]
MTVREATADDVEPIREVARRSWETDYPDIVSRETVSEGVEAWYGGERLADAVERPSALVHVAVADGDVVGFAHGELSGRTGHVLRLYVDPERRGRGVGGELLEVTLDALFDGDVDAVEATVLAANDPGNEFYRAHGFEKTGADTTTIGDESHPENVYRLPREAWDEP